MSASDKNNNGKRTDFAVHYSFVEGGAPACSNPRYGYSTNNIDEVDCAKCMAWLLNKAVEISNNFKNNNSPKSLGK